MNNYKINPNLSQIHQLVQKTIMNYSKKLALKIIKNFFQDNKIHIVISGKNLTNDLYQSITDSIKLKITENHANDSMSELIITVVDDHSVVQQKIAPNIIAIGSGKGGVGKSTVTVNMAYAFKKLGLSVGIIDADIYGPSIHAMLCVQKQEIRYENKKIIPLEKDGIKFISMGIFVKNDTPIIWRGPMIKKAVDQFLNDVAWKNLDILLLDLPPGTGDIHLTIMQNAKLTGAIIVSTPQKISLIDAQKAVAMFQKMEIPILGIIENMSYFICEKCSYPHKIFAYEGAKILSEKLKIPFLGEIPLATEMRELNDSGKHEELLLLNSGKILQTMVRKVFKKLQK